MWYYSFSLCRCSEFKHLSARLMAMDLVWDGTLIQRKQPKAMRIAINVCRYLKVITSCVIRLFKLLAVLPAWNDKNLLSICEGIKSDLVFAHVRASSGSNISRENCHPFKWGR